MKEQEQQIALCEWMGWKFKQGEDGLWSLKDPYNKLKGREYCHCESLYYLLPDTNSLDVLHEMEKKLENTRHHYEYAENLVEVCLGKGRGFGPDGEIEGDDFTVFTATASQRREALLKTLGLWKE